MRDYLLSRLAERSTWAGVIAVLGAFGVWNATPDQASAITAIALAIFGGFNTFAPDRMRNHTRDMPDNPVGGRAEPGGDNSRVYQADEIDQLMADLKREKPPGEYVIDYRQGGSNNPIHPDERF
jgi:hypothetical protein